MRRFGAYSMIESLTRWAYTVAGLLALPGLPGADAADALACAICHAHGGLGLGSLATAGYRVRGGRLV